MSVRTVSLSLCTLGSPSFDFETKKENKTYKKGAKKHENAPFFVCKDIARTRAVGPPLLAESEAGNAELARHRVKSKLAEYCLRPERVGLRGARCRLLKLVVGFPTSSYTVLLIAQFINSLSQIFVLSVPPTLAMVWYRESERGTATTVGSVANAVGVAIGMLVPPLWVKEGTDLAEGFRKQGF